MNLAFDTHRRILSGEQKATPFIQTKSHSFHSDRNVDHKFSDFEFKNETF